MYVVLGPSRHLGTLFLEGPQGLVPHLSNHFSSPAKETMSIEPLAGEADSSPFTPAV